MTVSHADNGQFRALEIGKAAEHLVCADLLLAGYHAFLSDQGLPYDVLVQVGQRIVRVQVKATLAPRKVPEIAHTPKYQWHVRRSGKGGKRSITGDEFDVLALVALDVRKVAYLPINERVPQSVHLRPPGVPRGFSAAASASFHRCVDEYPFNEAMAGVAL